MHLKSRSHDAPMPRPLAARRAYGNALALADRIGRKFKHDDFPCLRSFRRTGSYCARAWRACTRRRPFSRRNRAGVFPGGRGAAWPLSPPLRGMVRRLQHLHLRQGPDRRLHALCLLPSPARALRALRLLGAAAPKACARTVPRRCALLERNGPPAAASAKGPFVATAPRCHRDAIREAIHAVESAAIFVTGKQKATLGNALDLIQKASSIHSTMKSAFEKLYDYTNAEKGIRHALLESENERVGCEEALFIFSACTAFVGYLIRKNLNGAAHGIDGRNPRAGL